MFKSLVQKLLSLRKKEVVNGPILPTIIHLALPLMVSAALHTTQSLVDMFWVGRLGSASIAAVGISGSIIMVLVTLIFGVSSGTVSLVSQNIGAKQQEAASQVAMHSLLLAILGSAIVAVVGFIFAEDLLRLLGASNEVISVGTNYLRIILTGGVVMFVLFLSNSILLGSGDMIIPMIVMIVANILNIILDPLFIFGIGFPKMGTSGAALASVLSQLISCGVVMYVLVKGYSHVKIRFSEFRFQPKIFIDTLKIGVPSSLQMFFRSTMMIVIMAIVGGFGTYALAAYSIGLRVQMVILMPLFALGSTAATLVGQNIGAKQLDKAKRSALTAVGIGLIMMVVLGVLFYIFAENILRFFDSTPEVIAIGKTFFRITVLFYCFIAFGVVLNRALVGAGDTLVPMIITFVSLWVIQIPLAFFLSKYTSLGLLGVWWAIAVSYLANGGGILLWFLTGHWKKKHLKDGACSSLCDMEK
ncbi:MATE family efflux transporter [Candidatus Omnitrophota bacterium]